MKTLPKQTSQSGTAKSMFSPEDSHANPSPSLVEERERTITATSGLRCFERYGRYTPLGSLVKTLLESRRWWSPAKSLRWDAQTIFSKRITYIEKKADSHSTKSVQISKPKDIPSNRLLFQLAVSERPTEGIEYGLLQEEYQQLLLTPTAVMITEDPKKFKERAKKNGYRNGTTYGSLASQVMFSDIAHTQCDGYSSQGHGNQRAREKKSKEGQDRPQPGVRRHGSSKTSSYSNSHRQRRRANKQKSITECSRSSNLGTRRSKRLASHPYCNGDKTLQPSERTDRLSGFPLSPHSNGCGWNESKHEDAISQKSQQGECQPSGADSSQSRWRNFPTQSPVCRRNDGIPFDVDSLTISFPKWRQESIKAYGNAWVPQVAYEIFRAIEAEENNK